MVKRAASTIDRSDPGIDKQTTVHANARDLYQDPVARDGNHSLSDRLCRTGAASRTKVPASAAKARRSLRKAHQHEVTRKDRLVVDRSLGQPIEATGQAVCAREPQRCQHDLRTDGRCDHADRDSSSSPNARGLEVHMVNLLMAGAD